MAKDGTKRGRPKTWDAIKAHERLRALVLARMDTMTEAQISAAEGVKYLVARDKKGGKFRHLTEDAAKLILAGGESEEEIVEEWEKVPSTMAYSDLMNRALGKPAETVNTDVKGDITIKWQGE